MNYYQEVRPAYNTFSTDFCKLRTQHAPQHIDKLYDTFTQRHEDDYRRWNAALPSRTASNRTNLEEENEERRFNRSSSI